MVQHMFLIRRLSFYAFILGVRLHRLLILVTLDGCIRLPVPNILGIIQKGAQRVCFALAASLFFFPDVLMLPILFF